MQTSANHMAGGAHEHIVELSQVPRLLQDLQTVLVESCRQLGHLEIEDCQESPRHDMVRPLAFSQPSASLPAELCTAVKQMPDGS